MRKLLIALMCVVMTIAMMPAMAFADENVAVGSNTAYAKLKNDIDNAPIGQEVVVELSGDIENMSTDQIITIDKEKNICLDMNGHSIKVETNFEGRPFVNEGILTLTGNGTIDSSMSKNGFGAINNKGSLTIKNGTYKGEKYASGSVIRNTGSDAVLVIDDGTFEKATCAIYNEGKVTINNGKFIGTTCSKCNKDIWSYTIRNDAANSYMVINDGTFIGTQGAVSASNGRIEINGGTFKTKDCEQNHGAIFYALYIAGEAGKVNCVVNGGTFETEGKYTAVLVGNDNTGGDGGINEQATAYIKGGKFIAPTGIPALKGAEKTGNPIITGGTFSSDVSQYTKQDEGYYAPKNGETHEVVKFGKINAYKEDGTHIGTYDSFKEALNVVNDISQYPGTVKLVCDEDTYIANGDNHISVTRSILVEGNGAVVVPGKTSLRGEADFAVDIYEELQGDTSIVINDLYNASVWGTRITEHKLTVELNNCDTHEIADKTGQRIYINGATGENFITLKNCDIKNPSCAVYSNAAGSVVVDGCTFVDTSEPININTNATEGAVNISVKNTNFKNCGLGNSVDEQWAAPIRVVNSGSSNLTSTVDVDNCTFDYTDGNKSKNGDILIGDGRADKTSHPVKATVKNTKADIKVQNPGYYANDGIDESKQIEKVVEKNQSATIVQGAEDSIVVEDNTPPYIPGAPSVQKPVIEPNADVTTILSADGTTLSVTAKDGFEIVDVTVNGVSKGAVTTVTGLKTGDKVVIVTKAIEELTAAEKKIAACKETKLIARSQAVKTKSGKKAIKITWKAKEGSLESLDGVQIFRSTKRADGTYKKVFTSKSGKYINTSVKKGQMYYYKVRGYVRVDGKLYFTKYSTKAWRRV